MKALLEKIRKILRNRRTRQLLARTVSGFAAVVVFVTTYALVLPAITMEQEASCGITAHEHTDACYEERLVCQIPEDENHHHDASCYEKFLICGQQVHVHSTECYQQYTSAVVSLGSTTAASTDLGALVESELYSRDDSGDDAGSILTDSGSNALETVEEDSSASVEDSDLAAGTNPESEATDSEASGNGISENTYSVTTNPVDAESQSSEENKIAAPEENRDAAPEENESVACEGETGSRIEGVNDDNESLGLETADSPDLNDGSGSVSDASDRSAADTSDAGQEFNDSAAGTSDVKTENAETTDVESAKTAYTESAETAGTEAAAQEAANSATTNVLPEAAENENLSEGYVPELDSIEFGSVLNKHTDFYYFHPEEGQEIPASSAEITDWKKVKNDLFGSTELESTDLVKLYLSYTIPAGALNETNQVARYRLPSNIHLTDEQIIAINGTENGMSAIYAEADLSDTGEAARNENAANYQKYLGVEAIEGTRTPDRIRKEDEQEYISAIVKAENVFDEEGMYGEKGAFLGQDLIFIFTPYSIEKNQTTYNADGNPLSAGEKITGWFACDFNMSQIDWVEEDTDLDNSTVEKTAEIVFVEKDSEKNLKEISRTLKRVDVTDGQSDTAGEETARAADLEHAANGPFKSGTLTADGDGYRITLDYSEEAKIPENAELSVKEITAETDREAYETCLDQAGQQVAADDKSSVDQKASRFFDIEILVKDTGSEGMEEVRKIEPSAPVSVNIQIIDDHTSEDAVSADQKASQGDPAVLHFAGEGVEQIDSTVKISQKLESSEGKKSTGKGSESTGSATEISFEAESFSIYGVVYTVDFEYSVNGKMYQFSLPGGGFVSFTDLVEVLGIIRDADNEEKAEKTDTAEVQAVDGMLDVTASDAAKKFVADVEAVEFSSPELVWVGKADADTTVGTLKKTNGLECEYSAELTEKQIEGINSSVVESGDWALISMRSFDSEETMTVTMTDGEVFTIRVTDAQIQTMFLSDNGELYEVTVTYGDDAKIPDGAVLKVTEFEEGSEEYLSARKAVIADKMSRHEGLDLSTLGLAALDLAIVLADEEGNITEEIEPAAPVQVEMKVKALPGVEDLSKVADTLEIQHHVNAQEGVIVENVFDGGTEASFEMKTDQAVIAFNRDSVVDPETVSDKEARWYEESRIELKEALDPDKEVRLEDLGIDISFETPSFSTFTITWNYYYYGWTYPQTNTVKYVDENGNELDISNSINPSTDNASDSYLIYDIDGYEYDYCYLNDDKSNKIYPYIRNVNGYYYYFTSDGYGHLLTDTPVINVVYKKKNTPTKGGVPLVDSTSKQADPPSILKKSVANGDGTNTLSLNITGSQAPAKLVKLADIIVIFDRSGSMNFKMDGTSAQEYGTTYDNWSEDSRIKQAYDALDGFAESMLTRENSDGDPLVRMSLISFSTTAKVECGFTSDKDELMSAVQGLVGDGGTNWEHALQLANNEFRLAADANNVGPMELDPNRATFVVFITDGQPTFRMTRDNVKNNEFYENDETKRDIATSAYLTDHVFGHGMEDYYDRDYNAALKEAKSIVENEKILYSIGISGDTSELDNLGQLVSEAGAGEGHSVIATTQDKLIEAFDDIAERITGYTGQADIKMFDGITGLTNTISKVNQTDNNRLLGVDGDFTYWKSTAPADWSTWTAQQKAAYTQGMDYVGSSSTPEGYEDWPAEKKAAFQAGKNVTFTEWTTRAADGCEAAVYNTGTGAVEWNMGESFMLEDGVTYKVSFTCWPSQEAYDILAKLNNGTISFGDTTLYGNEVWNQFEGNLTSGYTLKTNAEGANTTYSKAASVDGTLTVDDKREKLDFQHVPPMPLTKENISVAKTWQASVIDSQEPESVIMQVIGDDDLYKQFEIIPTKKRDGAETNNWGQSDDIYISCGHLKVDKSTGAVIVYESGHDFTLREVEENSRHWDLDASTCRPMKINNQATMLVLVTGNDIPAAMTANTSLGYCASGSDEYYRIGGKVYKDTRAWADITGMNTRRSFLDLAKEVLVDDEIWEETVNTKFTYKIKIDIDPTTLSWDPNLEKYIVISIRGDGYSPAAAIADPTYPTTAKLPSQSGMASGLIHEGDDNKYLIAESGVEFYLSIRNDWSVRFLNLPAGTTYSIEEVLAEDGDYDFNNVRLETRKDASSQSPVTTDTYNTVKLEGNITETSTLYKVVYQNDAKTKEVQILKTGQDASTPLGGAKFDLYTESAYMSNPQGTPFKPNLVSSNQADTKGKIDLGRIPVGKYYLVETKAPDGYNMRTDPIVITVSKTSVTYSDGTTLSQSGAGISQIGDVYQLKVTNDEGVELPSTGGPGTCMIYLSGMTLISLAAAGLAMKRRRKAA
ncbi:MAG: VWA domain-containing protein [Lachnospiraceae bacterium]|nr:VWA domain-containing protein [Lachnospiraceae bacterium]